MYLNSLEELDIMWLSETGIQVYMHLRVRICLH